MTERLYYNDCYLQTFRANVIEVAGDGKRVYLDRTAFYPTSGGQPFDTGMLGAARVLDVIDEEDRIAHVLDTAVSPGEIAAQIDWQRRFDHMQQHTGQHLLSAVLEDLFKAPTVSFHLGAETSTIDVGKELSARQLEQAEERCAAIVAAAEPVTFRYEEAGGALDLRKPSERTGTLRIVTIGSFDRSACGGTHVRSTAEIGPVFIRKTEKVRGNMRIEFVCGGRALRHARSDFRTLQDLSRLWSAPSERLIEMSAAQAERMKALEKSAQKLASELAQREGRELWTATAPGEDGIRRTTQRGLIDEATRTRAQAFVAQGKALFLAICEEPPSLLLAASADCGVHAGDRVKKAVAASGGRGGGNQTIAQGSVSSKEALAGLIESLLG